MPAATQRKFMNAVETSLVLVSLLFVSKAVESISGHSWAGFGIVPRDWHGLTGIVFSPLLHGSWAHLLANATPLVVLLVLLFWDRHYFPKLTLSLIWVVSGLGTWLIGRGQAVHIGASALIFGLVTYLVAAGIFMRRWRSALIAVGVFLLFGGILYGVLPQAGPISWEGHLSGALTGVWAAKRNHD